MPRSGDLGQLRPEFMKGLILGSKIGPFDLIFDPHIEKHQTQSVCFMKNFKLIKKNLRKWRFKILSSIVMVKIFNFNFINFSFI